AGGTARAARRAGAAGDAGPRDGGVGRPAGVAPRGLAGGRAARGRHALAEPGDLGGARRPGGPGVLADGPAGAPALASGADRRPQRHHQVAERGARLAFRAGVPGVLRAVALAVIAGE